MGKLIVTRLGRGRVQHAAMYYRETGRIKLYCHSLQYGDYLPVIVDETPPSQENVTCKRCLQNYSEWSG